MTKTATYHDVVKLVLAGKSIGHLKASKRTLIKAVADLHSMGEPSLAEELEREHIGERGRGTKLAKPGDTRTFKAQKQASGGAAFIRLPVDALDVRVGEKVRAVFGDTEISVEKAV